MPSNADKDQLVRTIAPLLIESGEVVIRDGVKLADVSRNDVSKEGNF